MAIKVGVVGAAGYAGVELVRLLMAHPAFEVAAITSNADAGMRLADVYLMYAEAVNFANLEDQKPYAIELVNRVRHRGNLPPLAADKTGTQDAFFDAINQERIVELLAEGHRMFDLRRWRLIEESFCGPGDATGYVIRDTWGNPISGFSTNGTIFQNATDLSYEQCYIFQIPESERNRNSNLTQNKPWM